MKNHLIILIIFFIFVGFFIVKTSQFESFRIRNNLSDDERLLNQSIDHINRLISREDMDMDNRILKLD